MSRVCLALLLLAPSVAPAALDPEINVEYALRVPIQFGDHAYLTPDFRRELVREVQGQLQVAFGPIAKVEAFDLDAVPAADRRPLEQLFADKGFAALDGYNIVGPTKTHCLRVDFVDGFYEVSARQHDGGTGLASPVVRKQQTSERPLVGRVATLTVAHDFGAVGTVELASFHDDVVDLKLKAGALGPMTPWVRRGEVFVLSQVRQITKRPPPRKKDDKTPAPPPTTEVVGNRLSEIYLHITDDPKGDTVRCKVIQRYAGNVFPRHASVQGYRAMKLGTSEGKLRLTVVDTAGRPVPANSLRVVVLKNGFDEGGVATKDLNVANRVGEHFVSKSDIPHFGYVKVLVGPEVRAQVPMALVEDKIVTVPIRLEAGADQRARLIQSRLDFLTRVAETRSVQVRVVRDMTARQLAGDNSAAMKLVQSAIPVLENDAATFDEELKGLRARYAAELPNEAATLDVGAQHIATLRGRIEELKAQVMKFQGVIAQENDPTVLAQKKALDAKIEAAELLTKSFEIEKAIAKYDEVLGEVDQPKVRERRDKLATAWAVADDEHAAARKYVYDTMPGLSMLADIKAALPEVKKSFAKLKASNDRYSLGKMDAVLTQLAERVTQEIEPLKDPQDDEMRTALEAAQAVAKEVQEVWEGVTKTLREAPAP